MHTMCRPHAHTRCQPQEACVGTAEALTRYGSGRATALRSTSVAPAASRASRATTSSWAFFETLALFNEQCLLHRASEGAQKKDSASHHAVDFIVANVMP